jgi:SAM-dependent methyltransferase
MPSCSQRLERALALASPLCDILEQRVDSPSVPGWCEARGWTDFLLGLSEVELALCEARGLSEALPSLSAAPRSLSELAGELRAVTALEHVQGTTHFEPEALRSVKQRKRAQLSALLSSVAHMARAAERIVDVGAGSGHFTRLSAELFDREALGLEHDARRVAAAERRSQGARARFLTVDARTQLDLGPRDLAIGLHTCGELGDRLTEAAAHSGCDLGLVSCCLQKISSAARAPLAAGFELRREHLGLTNLTSQAQGVETSIDVTLRARETRYALGLLLRGRGVALEAGAEMRGINRRRAQAGLRDVAERALAQRGLTPSTPAELAHYQALGADQYRRMRRLSLPRSMLSRLVELVVSLDRAAHLERSGLEVQVVSLFHRAISPRNIGIFASRERSRLPAAWAPAS